MVPNKKMYDDAGIGQFRELSQDSGIPLRYDGSVFIPEIKQVSYNEYFFGMALDLIKKSDQLFFPFQARSLIGCTQVKIR